MLAKQRLHVLHMLSVLSVCTCVCIAYRQRTSPILAASFLALLVHPKTSPVLLAKRQRYWLISGYTQHADNLMHPSCKAQHILHCAAAAEVMHSSTSITT